MLSHLLSRIPVSRSSNFETGCPTLRHTVWSELYFTHDHWQDARNKIACRLTHVLSRQSVSQNVWLWDKAVQLRDILSDLETYSTQDYCQDARNKIACRLSHVLSSQSVSQNVWLWVMLFNFETHCLMLSHTSHKFTAKKPMTRLHASSLMFCQDNQWDRMSNLQTGCPISRHTVWSWDMPHTRSLPRRLLQDCVQALSYFVKSINEPECLDLRQAVQLRDILSDLETCLTQDYCQDARNKIACKLSHLLSRMSMSRWSDFETGLWQCGKTSRNLALGLSQLE